MQRGQEMFGPATRPIFILSLTRRSGTNFLYQLLGRHPDVAPSRLYEDFILHDAHLLYEYVQSTERNWHPGWAGASVAAALVRELGDGLRRFLVGVGSEQGNCGKRLVTKTPSIQNASTLFQLLPDAFLVIILRDGRDTVESGVRSFGWSYEEATRAWCAQAAKLLQFKREQIEHRDRYRIVRFEDLTANPEGQLREILGFLELDASQYDFTTITSVPVYGSSTFRGSRGGIDWEPVAKTDAFNPIGRWECWSAYRRRRFSRVAGRLMHELGYNCEPWRGSGIEALGHAVIDALMRRRRRSLGRARHPQRSGDVTHACPTAPRANRT